MPSGGRVSATPERVGHRILADMHMVWDNHSRDSGGDGPIECQGPAAIVILAQPLDRDLWDDRAALTSNPLK
jgi:hypothetical protein